MNVLNLDSGEKGRVFCEGETCVVVWTEGGNLYVWDTMSCIFGRDDQPQLPVPKATRRSRRKKNRGIGEGS